jgi:hypothetical protein
MFIDANTTREVLEEAAILECGFLTADVDAASDDQLREMITDWIEAGDECGGC